ncbi:hypothetical protein [Pedobacter ginsengisoli]|uniref:hypothetical protein n=1 Tax=Pedobacter ginsengisoli TaxID=363852 RepID=UPI00254BF63A|nr:hypothetical protein [Pedobacter ginsengisoli]
MKIIRTAGILFWCLLCCNVHAAGKPIFELDDFFITTTMNSIQVEFSVKNTGVNSKQGFVSLTVTDAFGKLFLEISRQQVVLAAGASKKMKLGRIQLKPRLWSPEQPVLYTMRVLTGSDHKSDVADVRKIGFKSFEIRNNLFYLNGNPYYLRALSQWPVSRIVDANGKAAPEMWNDERFVKKFFEKMKALHINAGRVGDHELWVRYADEMGILNIAGSYSGAGAREDEVFASNRRDFTPKISRLRNHVSTAIYTLSNEIQWTANPDFLRLSQENYEFARTLDASHPMIANAGFGKGKVGDIEDMHDYTGWYGGTVLDMDKYELQDIYKKDGGSGQPVTFTECVGTYTAERSGRFHLLVNKGLSNALRHVGRGGQHPDDPLWYQRLITKEMMEGMRRGRGMDSRLSGSFPYSDYWTWDVPSRTFSAKPAAEVLRQVYSPVLLSLRSWDRHAFAGSQIRGELYVVNDDVLLGRLSGATISVRLEQNGKTLDSLVVPVPDVAYYSTAKIPLSIVVPQVITAGPAKIVMSLNHAAARSVPNEMDVFVAARDFATADAGVKFMLYDPEGNTDKALKDIGSGFERVQDFKGMRDKPLVIGAGALHGLSGDQAGDVMAFVKNGGRVLVLEQQADQLGKSPLLPQGVKARTYNSLFVNTERPGLLDKGLANRNFFLWNQVKGGSNFPVTGVFNIQADVLREATVLANCGPALENPVVLEYFKELGSITFSQFEVVERSANDPVAAKVLQNLVEYLQSGDHAFGRQLTEDITFADLDSEAGLFAASLKQGMVLNSHNYGRVSWAKNTWPDGRRVTGEQRIINSLGYTGQVKKSDIASGFFYFRPPVGAKSFFLQVKNPVSKELWFSVQVNDKAAGDLVFVLPGTAGQYGPWSIPEGGGTIKITIKSHSDLLTPKREKPVIEELVFQRMIFK